MTLIEWDSLLIMKTLSYVMTVCEMPTLASSESM